MKKKLVAIYSLITVLTAPVFAGDSEVLRHRLNLVNSFYASFTQRITDSKGTVIQDGKGELWMKRPNLFNWHTVFPDESVLVSDGKTLWFYNPFVEQVTAYWLQDLISNTPFMLIISNRVADWQRYNVKQRGNSFFMAPKSGNSSLKQFVINITDNGIITSFIVVERDSQRSYYQLKYQKDNFVENIKFHFSIPKGVTLDDQRD